MTFQVLNAFFRLEMVDIRGIDLKDLSVILNRLLFIPRGYGGFIDSPQQVVHLPQPFEPTSGMAEKQLKGPLRRRLMGSILKLSYPVKYLRPHNFVKSSSRRHILCFNLWVIRIRFTGGKKIHKKIELSFYHISVFVGNA